MESNWGHLLSEAGSLSPETRAFLATLGIEAPGDEGLWLEALTHGSFGGPRNYERLEFLGDRVLGLVIAEWLHELTDQAEGQLSQRLNALVSREMCARQARSIGLAPHIRLGKQARDDGGTDSDNILGDVMEALLGASFVARGFEPTRELVRKIWAKAVSGGAGHHKHPKSALQEWTAGNRRKMPEYEVIDRSGPDHAAIFTVRVSVKGVGEAQASGPSKQEAEKRAAAAFMENFA
ncbi:ribonuclease III [Croceicoccus estronivorus]|nr:ribonuclease III [Croceicoccus estronivorus]